MARKLRALVAGLLWLCAGLLFATMLVVAHLFRAFQGEELVARVAISRLSAREFELAYRPTDRAQAPLDIRLRGDQWSVSGGIVKWHPWLTALGLKSYHRPTRLSGQFSRIEEQRAERPTVHPLGEATNTWWSLLYWMDPFLPFIDAAYGSAAYAFAEPATGYELYVSPTGYLIKRQSRRPAGF
jgi:hypothetical protein